jgi:hypothetical protein
MSSFALLVSLLASLTTPIASASVQSTMQRAFSQQITTARELLSNIPQTNCADCDQNEMRMCQSFHGRMESDGILDIRLAFGYFDISLGEPYYYDKQNLGQSPALDSSIEPAMRDVLTSSCRSTNAVTCGFSDTPDPEVIEKTVKRTNGQRVSVRIRMTHASASLFHLDNFTTYRSQQILLSETSERNFFGGLREADAVIYFGHARNGGGPDFQPVVLRDDKNPATYDKPNYAGYYLAKREGLNRMLENLTGNGGPALLALVACSSELHFASRVRKAAPSTALITTGDKIYSDRMLEVALGTVEALTRGSCGPELRSLLHLSDFAREQVLLRGLPLTRSR